MTLFERMLNSMSLLGRYLTLIAFPVSLSADYSFAVLPFVSGENPITLVTLMVTFALLMLTVFGVLKNKTYAPYCLWFFCAFLITSNLLVPIGTVFAERLTYVPGIGALALLVWGCMELRVRWLGNALLVLLFAHNLLLSRAHAPVWKNNETLHRYQITTSPLSAKTQLNYALLLRLAGDLEGAERHVKRALRTCPEDPVAAQAYASLLAELGKYDIARRWYQRALNLDPKNTASLVGIGKIDLVQGQVEIARERFLQALHIDGMHFEAQLGLLAVHISTGELVKAKRLRDGLLRWDSQNHELRRLSTLLDEQLAPVPDQAGQ